MDNCRSCRWGPATACERAYCSYEVASNMELLKRMNETELAQWLADSPCVADVGFWQRWLERTDEELIRRIDK